MGDSGAGVFLVTAPARGALHRALGLFPQECCIRVSEAHVTCTPLSVSPQPSLHATGLHCLSSGHQSSHCLVAFSAFCCIEFESVASS